MKKNEIKKARKDIEKMIAKSNKALLKEITNKYPTLIKRMRKKWDLSDDNLVSAGFYAGVEYDLDYWNQGLTFYINRNTTNINYMSTRSTTHIFEIGEDGKTTPAALKKLKPILSIYRQCDGYPSGMGADIAEFVKNMTIVNGYGMDDKIGTHANGAGCFAAQFVARLKNTIGNIYISTADDRQEYDYFIYLQACEPWLKEKRESKIIIRVESDGKKLFQGDPKKLAAWVKKQDWHFIKSLRVSNHEIQSIYAMGLIHRWGLWTVIQWKT